MPDGASIAGRVSAVDAAVLFAIDPVGTGGVALHAMPGPSRDRWIALLQRLLPAQTPVRRLPLNIVDSRMLGGLDLAATLRSGRPVAERGVLADADGGVVIAAMAERMNAATAAKLGGVLDRGGVAIERDGLKLTMPAQIGIVALDESIGDEERPPPALLDRLAFRLDLDAADDCDAESIAPHAEDIASARVLLSHVEADTDVHEAICSVAVALGVSSLRACVLAMRAARAAAALNGRRHVNDDDAAIAARLVLAPRATRLPTPEQPDDSESDKPQTTEQQAAETGDPKTGDPQPLNDVILSAAQAAIPTGILERLRTAGTKRSGTASAGRTGFTHLSSRRGRPTGSRRGDPRPGVRLNVLETIRAAAPWQRLRRRDAPRLQLTAASKPRLEIRREDFRIDRRKQPEEMAIIFAVDASGSAALHRLAEAKGAVELLLADCYVRRDSVALIAFRGGGAELLLPPTRSLVRAKRCLAALPAGGGTPLASGIDAARQLGDAVKRKGQTPTLVFLTDGRANICRNGNPGRARAEEDTLAAARLVQSAKLAVVLMDTSPRVNPFARRLAVEMAALYLPLPFADAAGLSKAVRSAVRGDPAELPSATIVQLAEAH